MKSAIVTGTLLYFFLVAVIGGAQSLERVDNQHDTLVGLSDDNHSKGANELVLVLDSDLESRPDREGCAFVIGAPVREANHDNSYDVEFCSRSTVSLPEGCEATTCMDVDEFQIVVRKGNSFMSAEVIDVAGMPNVETQSLIDTEIAKIANSNPLAAAGWQGRDIFTWATMLGTVAEATGDFETFHRGEAQYEGGLEFIKVTRGRGTLRFVSPKSANEVSAAQESQ